MDWAKIIHDLFFDYTVRTVATGSTLLGIVSGVLGVFAMLRRQSLLGDTVSHAALPGVALAFLLLNSKAPLVLLLGAMTAGWLGMLALMAIVRNTRIKLDSAMALILSVFFGFGIVLLSYTQRLPDASQAGLNKFLFGQAATMLESDVITIGILGGIALLLVIVLWKEFKILSFDRDYAAGLGFPVGVLDILLTTLLVTAIVIGLQAVGVILMSAMVVAPAAAARQWSDRLWVIVVLSAGFGAFSGVSGVLISGTRTGLATGPTIVVIASTIALLSLLFAPNRGVIFTSFRDLKNKRTMRAETVIQSLYLLAKQHGDPQYPHAEAVLRTMSANPLSVKRSLKHLESNGLVANVHESRWALTAQGVLHVEKLAARRRFL